MSSFLCDRCASGRIIVWVVTNDHYTCIENRVLTSGFRGSCLFVSFNEDSAADSMLTRHVIAMNYAPPSRADTLNVNFGCKCYGTTEYRHAMSLIAALSSVCRLLAYFIKSLLLISYSVSFYLSTSLPRFFNVNIKAIHRHMLICFCVNHVASVEPLFSSFHYSCWWNVARNRVGAKRHRADGYGKETEPVWHI